MARKLKVYRTSQGFYDLAVAAPSMKAALEAWGAGGNLFHPGFRKESGDSKVIAAAMNKPGVVLQRPVGSDAPFVSMRICQRPRRRTRIRARRKARAAKSKVGGTPTSDRKSGRKTAAAFEKERARRTPRRYGRNRSSKGAGAERWPHGKQQRQRWKRTQEHEEKAAQIERIWRPSNWLTPTNAQSPPVALNTRRVSVSLKSYLAEAFQSTRYLPPSTPEYFWRQRRLRSQRSWLARWKDPASAIVISQRHAAVLQIQIRRADSSFLTLAVARLLTRAFSEVADPVQRQTTHCGRSGVISSRALVTHARFIVSVEQIMAAFRS